jgi:predicted nucleic acid-binding protein
LPVINNYLLSEVYDVIVENKWMHPAQATKLIELIRKFSICTTENAVYAASPDPKDNYLFDLAIQNNCLFIITDDSKLLQFGLKSVHIHPTEWFLKTFPL